MSTLGHFALLCLIVGDYKLRDKIIVFSDLVSKTGSLVTKSFFESSLT